MKSDITKHKSRKEIEDEVGMTLQAFEANKKFNEDTPLQFTNKVVTKALAKESKEFKDARAFVGKAVTMYQTDYPKYREYMEKEGYNYEAN